MENSRHIGILQKAYEFCDKYNLSHDIPSVCITMKNALRTLGVQNKIDSMTSDEDKHYVNVTIYCMGEYMTKGLFTPEQLLDLANMGSDIKFES